jgi:hypothetical protein
VLIERHRNTLLRMKGIVRMRDGAAFIVQFARGDRHASVTNALPRSGGPEVASGVTLILRDL